MSRDANVATPAGRVVLLTELYPPAVGGSAVLFENIYSRLSMPVTVIADPTASGPSSSVSQAGTRAWVAINGRLRGVTHPAEWRQHLRVASAVRRVSDRATVVHCGRPLPEGLGALVGRGLGAPRYVCWAHGEELTAAASSREHQWLVRRVCRNASAMLANSRFTSNLVQDLGIPRERITVVYPGVDADRFSPDRADAHVRSEIAAGAECVLLTVGRLQRRKGHDRTIAAVSRLRASMPKLRYVIVGDGHERAQLEAVAREHGVADMVHFLGEVPDERLPALYAACDVFLMPTRRDGVDVEGFGIVFLEAAASGKPTIGGRNGGVGEAIADGRTGLLVDGDNVEEIARAIADLAGNRDRCATFGEAGRRRVLADFTWARAARQVEEVTAQVLTGRARAVTS